MEKGKRVVGKNETRRRMSKEEVENKKKRITKIFFGILVVIGLAIIAFFANQFIVLDNNKTTNLVINNKNITSNLKKDVLIQEDIIYLSKQDIANFFDKYIYEDKDTNKIITTYDKKIAAIGFEENKININGSDKKIYAHSIKKDDTIYLPISEMKDVYGIDIEYLSDSKVVVIESTNKEQKKAIVTGSVSLKSSTNFIAKTVDRLKKGSYVVVVSTSDGWTRIRTENGKLGYIKSNKLANEVVTREVMNEEKQVSEKVSLVWDYYSEYAQAPDRSGTQFEGVNVVSPSFFYIDKNGKFNENVGTKGKAYVEWAHDNGYKVWPMVSNAGDGMLTVTSKIMNSYESRNKLIENIVSVCTKYNLDGINIDFENMKMEDKEMFSRFIIELTPRLKEIGLVISVDVTAPDGGETWSLCFDRHVIGDVADYIVFMAYDEYGVSSQKAGTTAGYDWVELSLKKFLETEEIESEKIILAVPLYTRVWTETSDGKVTSNVVSMKNIDTVIPDGAKRKWDDKLKQNYAEYKDGSNTKKIWIEDIDSLKAKISLITSNNLGGVGAWQKGMESEGVFEMIKQELNQ